MMALLEYPEILLILKSGLVLIIAALAGRVMLPLSASTRHAMWTTAFAALFVLPLLTYAVPVWRPVSVSIHDVIQYPFVITPSTSTAPPPATAPRPIAQSTPSTSSPSVTIWRKPQAINPIPASAWAFYPQDVLALIAKLWMIGTLICLHQKNRRKAGIVVEARRSKPVEEHLRALSAYAADVSRLSGTPADRSRRLALVLPLPLREGWRGTSRGGFRVDVRIAQQGSRIVVPITWSLPRPIVLLPADAIDWDDDCVRAALLHEFAHIRRRDWWTMMLAHLGCALYWFNPLVWYAARRMREDGERACDDAVLDTGMAPVDYAQRLVDVLRSLPAGAKIRTVAVAMALPGETETRIRAILAPKVDRRRVATRTALLFIAIALANLIPIAAIGLGVQGDPMPRNSNVLTVDAILPTGEAKPFKANAKAELVAIADGIHPTTWWNPKGDQISQTPVFANQGGSPPRAGHVSRQFLFRLWGVDPHTEVTADFVSSSTWGSRRSQTKDFGELVVYGQPAAVGACRIRLGLADGPWVDTAVDNTPSQNVTALNSSLGSVRFSRAKAASIPPPSASVVVTYKLPPLEIRLVAVDKHGVERNGPIMPGLRDLRKFGEQTTIATFLNVNPGDIRQIRLQTRPYQVVDFTDLPVNPNNSHASTSAEDGHTLAHSPHNAPVIQDYANALRIMGHSREADLEIQKLDNVSRSTYFDGVDRTAPPNRMR